MSSQYQQQVRGSAATAQNSKGAPMGQKVGSPGGLIGAKAGSGAGNHLMLNQYMQNQNQLQSFNHSNNHQYQSQLSTFSGGPLMEKSKNNSKKSTQANQPRLPQQAAQQKQLHNTFSNNTFQGNMSNMFAGGNPNSGGQNATSGAAYHQQALSDQKKKAGANKHGGAKGSITQGMAVPHTPGVGGPSGSAQDARGVHRGQSNGVSGSSQGVSGSGMASSMLIPAQSGMNNKMSSLNNQSNNTPNQFSPMSSQKLASKNPAKKLYGQLVQQKGGIKTKQSKTTSANSPIASGQQLLMAMPGDRSDYDQDGGLNRHQVQHTDYQLTNNYVGGGAGPIRVQEPQFIQGENMTNSSSMTITAGRERVGLGRGVGGPHKQGLALQGHPPTTVQIKSTKLAGSISKTTNHSPTESKRLHDFIQQHPNPKGQYVQHGSTNSTSAAGGVNHQNLNLINQLQHNPQSMLHRVSQKQKQNANKIMQHDSSSEMNVNEGTGAEFLTQQDEPYDTQPSKGHGQTKTIQTIQQHTVQTLQSNDQVSAISTKPRNGTGLVTGPKVQQRSRMTNKSGSQGGQSSQNMRTSQRIDSSKNKTAGKPTYNQKRIQNSMQIHPNQMQKNQMNHQSSSSFMNNPPSINEEAIGVPQISQPMASIRSKNLWLQSEGNENLQKLNSSGMASYTMHTGAVVLGSDSSTNLNTHSKQKDGALIQAPLCIKVKSKTNTNPTRKNSPRLTGKFSVSQSGTNPLRESHNSRSIKNMMQTAGDPRFHGQDPTDMPDEVDPIEESESNAEAYVDGIDHVSQLAGEANISVQKPLRHQTKRNAAVAGGAGANNYYVVSPGGGSSATGQHSANPEQVHQQPSGNANQAIRQSIDKKIQNLQQVKSRVKGNSCKSVYQGVAMPSGGSQAQGTQAAQRIQSGQNKNFQSNNRRLNSPTSNLNAAPNSVNTVAKSHLAQFNKTQYATNNTQKSKFDQQQQIFLNMAVQKKIGGIASGKQRRENRNLLMKNQQNQMHDNSNSVVGSMGSMGSLGPLVGIQDNSAGVGGGQNQGLVGDMPEAGYNTMKYPIGGDNSKSNKNNDQKLNQMQLSQLQQMHLTNFNPMMFPNGEQLKQSQQQPSHQNHQSHLMNSVGGYNFQSMTMSGLSSQINATNAGGAAPGEMASTQGNFIHQQSKSSGPQQRQKKNASQNHHNQKSFVQKANPAQQADHQASTAGGANQSTTYYEQNRQSQPTKANMIVQRKAVPISKTTANVSKNPSIERGNKNTSMGPVGGGTFASGLMPINVSGGKSMQGTAATNFKMSAQQYKHGTKAYAQTSKVSYNNSPNNRNKGGSLGIVAANIVTNQGPHLGPAGQQQMGAHQNQTNKRQQQLRQQPIGQPMGDIPLLSKEQVNMQNNFQSNQNDNGQMSKHQFHNSVLVGSDLLQSGYQTQQNQHFSKGAANPQNQSPSGNAGNPPSLASSKKELSPNRNQLDSASPMAGASQRGKLKLKVMSQTNSPKEKFDNSQGDAMLGHNSQYGSTHHNRGQASYNNKKGKLGAANVGNSQGGRSGRGLVGTGSGSGQGGASAATGKQHPHTTSNSQNAKNKPQAEGNSGGQQYFNQYFKQNKKHNGVHIQKYGGFGKLGQIDSPKDGSIERARQNDMIQQEQQVTQMNQHLQNVVYENQSDQNDEYPQDSRGGRADKGIDQGQFSQSKNKLLIAGADKPQNGHSMGIKALFSVNNSNQQCIIQNIETSDVSQLSPRSKEVYLIKQLIVDCFEKYGKPPKTQLELYKIGKMLGKGAFGKVNLGLHRLTRKLVAIKSINMDFMKEESQKKKIMNEINILKSLRHPNNIKILETFQTDKHHMIVMELCPGGDLLNYVRKRRKLTEKYAKFVFKQIMEGITYLHENKVSHRDIKLDNILLDGHGNIKIGDFGVSRKVEENELLFEQCGTPAYIAPEIVKDMGYKGFPVDIWSAGICLFAMLYGNVPFKANQIGDLNTVEQLNQEIEYKDTVSKDAIDLMKHMLQKVPKQRATAQEVLQHQWLCDEIDEHIDIFDEQELELIRKEFTYVLQKKKLKEFMEQKERLVDSAQADLPYHQASRRPDDLNTEFTECSIQTHQNSLLKNDSSRSVILCPFNTQTGDKTADKIIAATEGLMEDKDVMMRFHPRVRELDRNYEKLNNQDFDNGVYHKYAYKQKVNQKKDSENKTETAGGIKEENIKQSDVQMNNLVADNTKNGTGSATNAQTARKRRREKADINYHNYYIKINDNIIQDTSRLGFPVQYIHKCLRENANNHCTTTYYLLCMDQNF